HTLNIRLFPDQLTYIVNHAEDEVIFVDRSLVGRLWPLMPTFESARPAAAMAAGKGGVPDDPRILAFEALTPGAEPAEFPPDDSTGAVIELMESERVTLAAGVPTIWMGVLPLLEGRDLSPLRRIVCGGSAVPRALSEAYREKLGLPILQAWGMTETSPLASVSRTRSALVGKPEEELADQRATAGLIVPGVDVRIVAADT